MIEIITALALVLIGVYTGQLILVLLGFGLVAIMLYPKKQAKAEKKEEAKVKYRHRVMNSEPPREYVLTPAEMGAPFYKIMNEDLEKQKEKAKADGKELKVDMDAFPIFRGDPLNPAESLFSMLPFDILRKGKVKRKNKAGEEKETNLFEELK